MRPLVRQIFYHFGGDFKACQHATPFGIACQQVSYSLSGPALLRTKNRCLRRSDSVLVATHRHDVLKC
jgi:hypothetical protein